MDKLSVESSICINRKKHPFISEEGVELLRQIEKTGSITKAAKAAKMCYKKGWDTIKQINDAAEAPLTRSAIGGKKGGGSALTPTGHLYVQLYDRLYEEQRLFFDGIEEHIDDYDECMRILNRKTVRTSARNQLHGKVVSLKKEGFMTRVEVNVSGILIKASITTNSAEELALKDGSTVWLIIKASWVELAQNDGENVFDTVVINSRVKSDTVENTFAFENKITIVSFSKSSSEQLQKGEKVKIFIDKSKIIVGI
ncbi:MAG: TOBE domain-containing protein [Campylobacteraceae bacterium]|jgi:molybdate transport system regulatory protein|nr:TOBE domain-containing protein [Campylobacteraceae bacterium]